MQVFCVIPAYNEEKTISRVIQEVFPYVDKIVVIDDGSRDNTYNLAQKEGAIVLRHLINRGQGAALETGNQYALSQGANIIVHFDADGQFLASEIPEIIAPIKNGEAQIVFGSRFLDKKSHIPWFKKNIIIPLAHLVNKIFIGKSLSDPQSGFRALSRQAAQKIRIEQDDMAHCSEIIYKALDSDFKIKEVPITVIYHDFGQRLAGGVRIVKDLILGFLIKL